MAKWGCFYDQKLFWTAMIAQELFAYYNRDLVSWQEGSAEIEFLITQGTEIIPLEVKSSTRQRKAKSLDAYIQRYSPEQAIKLTGQNYGYTENRKITTAPLYSCSKFLNEYQLSKDSNIHRQAPTVEGNIPSAISRTDEE